MKLAALSSPCRWGARRFRWRRGPSPWRREPGHGPHTDPCLGAGGGDRRPLGPLHGRGAHKRQRRAWRSFSAPRAPLDPLSRLRDASPHRPEATGAAKGAVDSPPPRHCTPGCFQTCGQVTALLHADRDHSMGAMSGGTPLARGLRLAGEARQSVRCLAFFYALCEQPSGGLRWPEQKNAHGARRGTALAVDGRCGLGV